MTRSERRAAITGWGMSVPDTIFDNAHLQRLLNDDTTDEWIVSRTGIHERRIAGPTDSATSLSLAASREALDRAGLAASDIDLIICSTCTPDQLLVSQASLIQAGLGSTGGAFDVGAASSGFVYALSVGAQLVQRGTAQRVLIVGVDIMTRYVDYTDRDTCILFGDGAGAVVLEGTDTHSGVLASVLGADSSGNKWQNLYVPGWLQPLSGKKATSAEREPLRTNSTRGETATSGTPARAAGSALAAALANRPALAPDRVILMNGGEVFGFAVRVLSDSTKEVVQKAGLKLEDIDLIVPHQANGRIIEAAARRLHVGLDRFAINLGCYGNTSAASVPIALYEAAERGRLGDGDDVVCVGFGAGFSWAAVALRWGTGREESTMIETM